MSDASVGKTVLITSTVENGDSTKYDHIISVENLLMEITRDDILDSINRVSALDVPNTGCIDFSIVWRRITKPQTNNLIRAILLSQQLESHLDELDVTHGILVCGESLEEPYVRVVEDIAKTTKLETKRLGQKQSVFTLFILTRMTGIIIKMGFVISDWFITQIIGLFKDPTKKRIIYIPAIERLNSTLSVVDFFETKPQTIVSEPFWYYILQFDVKSRLNTYNPTVVQQYLSVSGLAGQIRDLITLFYEVLTVDSFAPGLNDAVEAEFGVYLESTTKYHVRSTLSNFHLVRALALRRSFRALFTEDHIEKVVIGTLDPIGRAIIHEALEQEIQVYHIPHSIATTNQPNPRTELVQFLSGEMDIQHYERVVPQDQWWRWVPAGRPYLSNLADQYGDQKDNRPANRTEHDRFKVLLATQPFSWSVRKQFVETTLSLCGDRFDVTIKPHPDENIGLYEEIESEYENVRVITADLYEEIVKSDLTVTISSNVGLESIVIGTPVVCFNAWEPFILEQTFAFADEVPVFKSEAEFQTFTSQLDTKKLTTLQGRQQAFAKENYYLGPDIERNIVNYIESDTVEF